MSGAEAEEGFKSTISIDGKPLQVSLPVEGLEDLTADQISAKIDECNSTTVTMMDAFMQAAPAASVRTVECVDAYRKKMKVELDKLQSDLDRERGQYQEATESVNELRDMAEREKATHKRKCQKVCDNLKQLHHDTSALRQKLDESSTAEDFLKAKESHEDIINQMHRRMHGIVTALTNPVLGEEAIPHASPTLPDIPAPPFLNPQPQPQPQPAVISGRRAPPTPPAAPGKRSPTTERSHSVKKKNKVELGEIDFGDNESSKPSLSDADNEPGTGSAEGMGGGGGSVTTESKARPAAKPKPPQPKPPPQSPPVSLTSSTVLMIRNSLYNIATADDILEGVTEEMAGRTLYKAGELIRYTPRAFLVTVDDDNRLDREHPNFDPNFTAYPAEHTHLTKAIRSFWRMFEGDWVDRNNQTLTRYREFKMAGIEYDQDSIREFGKFVDLFGNDAYYMWPLAWLRGPSAWIVSLTAPRLAEHMRWVETVQLINAQCPDGHRGYTNMRHLPDDWFNHETIPDTQVYVGNCPEIQDLELTQFLNTWGGILWPGNPYTIALSILKEDAMNNQPGVNNGLAAIRFVTKELAELFTKFMDGVEVYYQQYDITNYRNMSPWEFKQNQPRPELTWYKTTLKVSFTEPDKKRGMSTRYLPHPNLLDRLQSGKHQHCLWQSHVAAYDYPAWSIAPNVWMVDPFTGYAFVRQRNINPNTYPYICAPDASYWDAMGLYHPRDDGTIRSKDIGCWVNVKEREVAMDDETFFTPEMSQTRDPIFTRRTPNYRSASRVAGRVHSRGRSARRG